MLNAMESEGTIRVTKVAPLPGIWAVSTADVVQAITADTCLVTIMLANNETGSIQPVQEIVDAVRARAREQNNTIRMHTDAAQAVGKIPVNVLRLQVDYGTIVGHKFYGPRVGALFVRGCGTPEGSPM